MTLIKKEGECIMNDFEIINLEETELKILIIMKTCDSPFDYMNELQEQLRMIKFSGTFMIDELLHSGNNDERFISGFFDGDSFDNSKFKFENIAKKNPIRNYVCQYLQVNLDVLEYSGLTEIQQKLISRGCVV